MRISDWSSDVCSSDLRRLLAFTFLLKPGPYWKNMPENCNCGTASPNILMRQSAKECIKLRKSQVFQTWIFTTRGTLLLTGPGINRKNVEVGKSGSGSVDVGGCGKL